MATDYTKDFKLLSIILTTAKETIDLRYVMTEINVYECIWNNQITCDVLINDAQNLIMNSQIVGFETLLLEFQTPDKATWSKEFKLIRISNRELMRERQAGYVLHFVTFEGLNNLRIKVSKAYKPKLISEIVDDIHNGFLGGGPIDIEGTKYIQHIIIPYLHPCQAINWLATRANSGGQEGANYLYYQDKDMFRFVTIESRLALKAEKKYLFQVANVRKDSEGHKPQDFETNILAAESYTFDNSSDILENTQEGMYGNELLTYSYERKLWKRYEFDYPGSFDDYKHLYPGNYLYPGQADVNKKECKLKLHTTGHEFDGFPFKPEKWLPCRISQLQQLQNIRLTITIPGDSERTVGQVVEFNLPSAEPPIKNKQVDDKFYMGRYLIQSLRHKIDNDKYTTTLELIKESTFTKYQ